MARFYSYLVIYLVAILYCTFLPKRPLLLPTNHKIRGLVSSQNCANIRTSMPISLQDLAINLYTSVVDFIYFRRPVEEALNVGLASTLTCLYGDIRNHYALNLGHCFSVGWDIVCRLVFSYTLDNFFGSFFPIRS